LHGHNYLVDVTLTGDGDMVVDFAEIKAVVGGWLDHNWDHRCLLWEQDLLVDAIPDVVRLSFVPTAENMARHLLQIAVDLLPQVVTVRVWETSTAWAQADVQDR
jgi:6-pyruvoyltetrahydropterin/6-carboxytetrahydropterin synthase